MTEHFSYTCDQCKKSVKLEDVVRVEVVFARDFSREGDFCTLNCAEEWFKALGEKVS